MSGEVVHAGTTNWWNGTFTTWCGEVWPTTRGSKSRFFGPTCPGCIAAKKAKRPK